MTLQKTLKSICFISLFLIPFFPLIVANPFFFPFITGKAFYFRILVELAFVSWIVLAFIDARYRPKFTALTIGITIFALVALLADLLGVNPLRSIWSNFERMEGWLVIAHLWAFFMVISNVFNNGEGGRKNWHNWFLVNLGVASTIGMYSLLQLAEVVAIHQGSARIDASLGNAAYLAVYMLFSVWIASYLFITLKNKMSIKPDAKNIWIYWITIIASLIIYAMLSTSSDTNEFFSAFSLFISSHPWIFIGGLFIVALAILHPYHVLPIFFSFLIFQTQTRGTILGLIGGILLALALYAIFAKKEAKKSRMFSGGIIIAIIILGITFWANRDASFIQNNATLNRLATISWNENKTQARGYIWPMAVSGALERPIFGWGQENFNYIFNQNYEPRMWSQEQWFDRAHSVYLDWFVASGFVGLFAYLALYILFIVVIWKRSNLTIAEKSVLTGLIAGYAIHNIFVFDNIASYVFFFALLGFASSLSNSKYATNSKIAKKIDQAKFSKDAIEYVVAPIVLVFLVAGLYFLNIRPIQANTRLISALSACYNPAQAQTELFTKALETNVYTANQEIREQVLSCSSKVINGQTPNQLKEDFFVFAKQQIEAQTTITPNDARMFVIGGSFLSSYSINDSLPLIEKAHELTPAKQSVNFLLANTYLNIGKKDEAIELLKTTYESDPSYGEAKSQYIVGLIVVDKEKEARDLFASSSPELFETNQVARAYSVAKKYPKAIALYKKLIANDSSDVQLKGQLAEVQFQAGMLSASIETLKGIAKDHPETKAQVDDAIKKIQEGIK